jgi:hypothetical protein
MNLDPSQFGPNSQIGYVPYFYNSGRFINYNITNKTPASSYSRRLEETLYSNHQPAGKSQTVEDIVKRGYLSIPPAQPEEALISDKKYTGFLGLDDAIRQIRDRWRIYQDNIYQIELSKCYAVNTMYSLQGQRGGVRLNSREVYSLNKNISEFYQQQRDERVRLWKDISRLKQLLPEHARNYLNSYRKLSILEDRGGDLI